MRRELGGGVRTYSVLIWIVMNSKHDFNTDFQASDRYKSKIMHTTSARYQSFYDLAKKL